MQRRDAIKRISLLMGGAISAPTLAGLMGGCRAGPSEAAFTPQTLTSEQNDLVATLAELIIPETDTPGARAAGVHEFIDLMLTEWYPAENRDRFLAGLDQVNARAQQAYGNRFVDCTPEQRVELATQLDQEAFTPPSAAAEEEELDEEAISAMQSGTDAVEREREEEMVEEDIADELPFFRVMKELTVSGYYTSELGATEELRMVPMGVYRGDIPYAEIGRAWA